MPTSNIYPQPKVSGPKRILKDKKCGFCNNLFRPDSSIRKFCSYDCAVRGRKKKGKVFTCICGNSFYRSQSTIFENNYCSRACFHKANTTAKKIEKKCRHCGKQYLIYESYSKKRNSYFCSIPCTRKHASEKYKVARTDRTKHPEQLRKFKKWVWKHFSDYVRERDNWTCFTCGRYEKGSAMHAGHFISRVKASTLFDEMNVHAQCYGCNIGKKGNAGEYAYRLIQKYGQKAFDELVEKSRMTHRFTREELEGIYQHSKARIKELKTA